MHCSTVPRPQAAGSKALRVRTELCAAALDVRALRVDRVCVCAVRQSCVQTRWLRTRRPGCARDALAAVRAGCAESAHPDRDRRIAGSETLRRHLCACAGLRASVDAAQLHSDSMLGQKAALKRNYSFENRKSRSFQVLSAKTSSKTITKWNPKTIHHPCELKARYFDQNDRLCRKQ